MRSRLAVTFLIASTMSMAPAHAATIFTFGITGTAAFDTDTIESYSFNQSGSGGTLEFTKAIDQASDDLLLAVASGTTYPTATFTAYESVISPQSELFRYTLTDILFTSISLGTTTESVTLAAATATFVAAGGASVFTFSVGGTTNFDTDTIHSYGFLPSGGGGTLTFTKDIDATTPDILQAVALGTLFPNATFVGYDDVISPQAEVFRYALSNIMFTSVILEGVTPTERVTLTAQDAAFAEGPAAAPEPASGLMLLAAATMLVARRAPGRWSRGVR